MEGYVHLRIIVSLILGLSITRVLSGLSRRLQEPDNTDLLNAQTIWAFVLLIGAVHFWWWEFALRSIEHWNFWIYVFVLAYASLFFLMSTLLYPDHIQGVSEREVYFIRRRRAFFVLFCLSFIFDFIDTLIKGIDHLYALGPWYGVRLVSGIGIALLAMFTSSSRRILLLGSLWMLGNIIWITALYSDLI